MSTQTGHVITRLRKEHRETQFSRYFFDLLELRSGDALSDVTEIVADILNKLISQQGTEDAEFATKEADLQARISTLENDLEAIEAESQATRQLVGDLSSEIASLAGSIHFQAKQVQLLTQQVTDLDETYTQQTQASSEKYDANNKLLKAVQEVLKYIENTLVSGSLIQRNDALKHMKHALGDKHPITLLVSMTQDFDINTVHRVVAKLEAIEDRLRDTLTSIDEYNVQLQQTHQLIKSQVQDNSGLLEKDLDLNRRIANQLQNDFVTMNTNKGNSIKTSIRISNRRGGYSGNTDINRVKFRYTSDWLQSETQSTSGGDFYSAECIRFTFTKLKLRNLIKNKNYMYSLQWVPVYVPVRPIFIGVSLIQNQPAPIQVRQKARTVISQSSNKDHLIEQISRKIDVIDSRLNTLQKSMIKYEDSTVNIYSDQRESYYIQKYDKSRDRRAQSKVLLSSHVSPKKHSAQKVTQVKKSHDISVHKSTTITKKYIYNGIQSSYEGTFKDGKRHGIGTLYDLSGNLIYSGEWKDDVFWGNGKLVFREPKIKQIGMAMLKNFDSMKQNRDTYSGAFIDGEIQGVGQMLFSDKQGRVIIYYGYFQQGVFHGKGVVLQEKSQQSLEGEWSHGQLIRSN